MNEFNGVADTMLIPMAARIYASKHFPEYFYDGTALSLESKIPAGAFERIWKSSSQYTMLASVARYYNFDEMIKGFYDKHEKCAYAQAQKQLFFVLRDKHTSRPKTLN